MENVISSEVWAEYFIHPIQEIQLNTVVPYSIIASYKLKYGKTVVSD